MKIFEMIEIMSRHKKVALGLCSLISVRDRVSAVNFHPVKTSNSESFCEESVGAIPRIFSQLRLILALRVITRPGFTTPKTPYIFYITLFMFYICPSHEINDLAI